MQTIHIDVRDTYAKRVLALLENLRGVMLEDIKIEKKPLQQGVPQELIKAQQNVMQSTWDNEKDKEWDAL
ncbi:MAG: hypothetical protein PHS10_08350 [Thiovulaceae bacterium]|nr:hypothetical protein [Sulfurimonadaceae bacterium]